MRDFTVIAVATLKGGVRKTTTAAMLGFAYAARKLDVLLIDADTHTQGLTDWMSTVYASDVELPVDGAQWSRRDGGFLVPFVQRKQAETGAQVVILDMGAEDPDAIRQVLPIVDRVLSPVGPEDAELRRMPATRALVAPAEPLVLLTRVDRAGMGSAVAARQALSEVGLTVARWEVERSRTLYADAFGTVPTNLGAYTGVADEVLPA